ncbi:MAG: aminopeptidase P N-terminal domain-containing protein [Candidatus Thalassarchaeaceae archaeon]|nr:aminopeptidase P N-terminal domain-containing protein [Candidatus Thalassarchaeaceae archaeon]
MFDGHGLDLSEAPPPISDEELRDRQTKIAGLCGRDSILIIVNNSESIRSADVEYPYRASSDMLYFSGWDSPHAIFCICNGSKGAHTTLFVPPRDTEREIWTGLRLGTDGAKKKYPIDNALSIDEIESELPKLISNYSSVYHQSGSSSVVDQIVEQTLLESRKEEDDSDLTKIYDPRDIISEMRLRKSNYEIELMRYSCKIASAAHVEAMMRAKSGMPEYQLQAIIEGCFIYNGSQWSYPSIVGGGDNGTILHYSENDSVINDGDLVLIDAGCEVKGYASDITRTWPINGKFTEPQRLLYQLVLDSQIAAIEACKPGATFEAPNNAAREVLAWGLLELGIITGPTLEEANSPEQLGVFFMHRTSHWIGLDVHDVGVYTVDEEPRLLEPGMVLTIEPGLYFGAWRPDIEIDDKWAGIGIRIEDDVLITESGYEVLTDDCPKTIQQLEAIIGSST